MRDTFLKELIDLMKKHNVTIASWPNYGDNESYLGDDVEFLGEGWNIPINDRDFDKLLKE